MKTLSGFIVTCVALAFATFTPVAAQDAPLRLTATDGQSGDRFGATLAGSDEWLVVGAPHAAVNGNPEQGAVYVFARRGCDLVQVAKLVAADGRAGDRFGGSIAMTNDMIIIGATNAGVAGQPDRGAAYVFGRERGRWVQMDKLAAREGYSGDNFGASVATDGRRVLVGAPQASGDFGPPGVFRSGAAYVFELRRDDWEQRAELEADRAEFLAAFGQAVAIDDRLALIGAPAMQDHSGAVYRFERDGNDWEEEDRMTPGPGGPAAAVGSALAGNGEYMFVGAPGSETSDTFMSGVVYVYEIDDEELENGRALVASDWSAGAGFGGALAADNERIAVGASGAGRAYVFQRGDGEWRELASVSAPRPGERYGRSVAMSAKLLAVGASDAAVGSNANQGAVYVYRVGGAP